ncbi:hypothetical protein M0657_004539 [Pyricularia oryzae]|uniref:Uncharacterized protein n=1 Tax=Pyricularia oryzae TaxID=318829 RepID=A0A4V1C5P0_PYROR|nr:hypothetical protein M0657_004539 [Pyricularia oryzae]KAI7925233.1 hypothetical protein M9X92_003412 [Pyricularia oryzae]QBZ57055.1 hypothetical protein PoMZ_01975 [Pyricularia oryzae]
MRDLGRESGKSDVVVKPTALGATFELDAAPTHEYITDSKRCQEGWAMMMMTTRGRDTRAAKGLVLSQNGSSCSDGFLQIDPPAHRLYAERRPPVAGRIELVIHAKSVREKQIISRIGRMPRTFQDTKTISKTRCGSTKGA